MAGKARTSSGGWDLGSPPTKIPASQIYCHRQPYAHLPQPVSPLKGQQLLSPAVSVRGSVASSDPSGGSAPSSTGVVWEEESCFLSETISDIHYPPLYTLAQERLQQSPQEMTGPGDFGWAWLQCCQDINLRIVSREFRLATCQVNPN